jgi:hypothetical protein
MAAEITIADIMRDLPEPIKNALHPFIKWADNDRLYDDELILDPKILKQFQREKDGVSLLLTIVLKNVLLLSKEDPNSKALFSDGCNRYISSLLSNQSIPMNWGTINVFNLFLANTTGIFNGITDENTDAMKAYVKRGEAELPPPSGGKRKSKRKCKKSKHSRKRCK